MRGYLIPIFFVLFLSSVYAVDITVKSEGVHERISALHEASFRIFVTNNEQVSDTFTFEYFDIDWRIVSDPLTLAPGQSGNAVINVVPVGNKQPGRYGVNLQVISSNNPVSVEQHTLAVDVLDYKDIFDFQFEPVVPEIDPRKPGIIRLQVENKLDLPFESIVVQLKNDLLKSEKVMSIDASDTQVLEFPVEIAKETKEGDYPLVIGLSSGTTPLMKTEQTMRVSSVGDTREQASAEHTWLIKRVSVVKKNEGNSVVHELYNYEVSGFEKIFTRASPEPTSIVRSQKGYTYRWEFDLQPQGEQMISIEVNYRTTVLILLGIILIGGVLYYFFRRDIKLEKRIVTIKKEKDDISTIKVVLTVKNKSIRHFKAIRVVVRTIKELESPKEFGTLPPEKLRKTEKGVEMVWLISHLAGGEERIITYKMTSPLKIGNAAIPPAYLKYPKGGRSILVRSNLVKLFSGK